ncbi:polyketide synthase [Cordyceps javanica]|nr:polyketide synthase [Cordyceps javanica]
MSCRLPGGATDTEKFWEILESGLDVSREIPADRFDIDTHFDAEGKDMNKTMTRYGCFIDDPASFDAAFFNMSPREALAVDPQMRLMLVTAYEALEKAGFIGNRTLSTKLDRIGTYFGQAADDYREVNQGQEVGTYYIPGGCRAFGPGRINYFFKFAGPSYSVDTACSSGLAAIELACQALWNGNVDMVVTGGVNILTNPDGFTGLGKGHFLTKGHNACSLVIKRLEDAQADNDNILGLILATGTNHSAEAVSITHPHAGHQAYLSRQVIRQAGINPLDVSYIELHGTGTQAGDYEEMKGVLDVYAPASAPRRRSDQPLHIGSVKSNLGHGESVAGTTALMKVLLMLQKNAIPRHIGIKTEINPRFPKDFDKRNVHIPLTHTPWVQQEKKRIAAVNNFGAAGGNTMMIVEEAPTRVTPQIGDTRGTHAVVISAKTKTSLSANIRNLVDHLRNNSETVSLPDLGYTTTARRYQHSYRAAVTASSIDQVIVKLLAQTKESNAARPVAKAGGTAPSVAFAFTGQGASYSSMALELYHDASTFRDHIQHLDSLARGQGFPSFISAIDGTHPKEYVHSAIVTQLALVCIEMALAHYWQSLGVTPQVVAGHSLGEYAALQVAGVISASDAVFMVGKRAEMLQNACEPNTYCMLAVRASPQNIVKSACGKPYTIACINSPGDTVLSGTVSEMDDIALTLEAAGFRCIKLKVPYAFHSEQTDPILDEFEAICRSGVVFHEPKLPIISPLLCKVVFDDSTFNAEYVRRATREAVDFVSALENAEGVSIDLDTIWIEIGPHPVCTGFVHSTLSSQILALPSIRRDESNWKTLTETMSKLYLAGVGLNWNEFHRPFEHRVRLLDLPAYAWDEKPYWMQYNGDWCLTKGNTFYDRSRSTIGANSTQAHDSENVTSLVHKIVEKHVESFSGSIVMRSDLMQKDFLAAANGHRMNDSAVVTSSIHADIAYTLGQLLYKEFFPDSPCPDVEITNLFVEQALIAQKGSTSTPQIIQVTARTADIHLGVVKLTWQNVNRDMTISEPFANATIVYGKAADWLSSWAPISHLVQHRIEMLDSLAARGEASRLTRSMAYTLFAKNLVDYADKYRGMQSVVMRGLEGFADVQLSAKEDLATWTVAPYFIDSVAHLAGFIMNCSDAIDTQANYCVTSGWGSMRFATPLVAGDQYRSYVKMVPTEEDPSAFIGDVIILRAQDNAIVGMVQGIRFRRFPRILLNRFFTAPVVDTNSDSTAQPRSAAAQQRSSASNRLSAAQTIPRAIDEHSPNAQFDKYDSCKEAQQRLCPDSAMYTEECRPKSNFGSSSPISSSSGDEIPTPPSKIGQIADKALALIARETALDITSLVDDADFACLGIDSLMSLVLAEKFRLELDVQVNGSLFLDYPTIGDLRSWLIDYHG